jgi:hypothetical protein
MDDLALAAAIIAAIWAGLRAELTRFNLPVQIAR